MGFIASLRSFLRTNEIPEVARYEPLVPGFVPNDELDSVVSELSLLARQSAQTQMAGAGPGAVAVARYIDNETRELIGLHGEQLTAYLAPYVDAPEPTSATSPLEAERKVMARAFALHFGH